MISKIVHVPLLFLRLFQRILCASETNVGILFGWVSFGAK